MVEKKTAVIPISFAHIPYMLLFTRGLILTHGTQYSKITSKKKPKKLCKISHALLSTFPNMKYFFIFALLNHINSKRIFFLLKCQILRASHKIESGSEWKIERTEYRVTKTTCTLFSGEKSVTSFPFMLYLLRLLDDWKKCGRGKKDERTDTVQHALRLILIFCHLLWVLASVLNCAAYHDNSCGYWSLFCIFFVVLPTMHTR